MIRIRFTGSYPVDGSGGSASSWQSAMSTLLALAAKAIESDSRVQVVNISVSEDHYNKVFLLTMNDGREVVAKLPNPNTAGRPHFVTASEVATMDFVLPFTPCDPLSH